MDRDALIGLEVQEMGVAGDDKLGFGGDGAGEDVIVIGIALDHRLRKCIGCDGLGQARLVLHKLR